MTIPMARQYWRPSNMLYPVPAVMVSCADEEGRSNIMTAAWTGSICSNPVMVSVSIRPERYSHGIITRTGEFVINLTTEQLTYAADFCGVRSGRDVDKFEHLGLTKVPSRCVSAPSIGESPVCLECVVTAVEKLGTHDLFIAKVVQVSVDEQYLDEKGRLALEDAGLVAYVHGVYLSLGKKLGTFGFSVRKKSGVKKTGTAKTAKPAKAKADKPVSAKKVPEKRRAIEKRTAAGRPEKRRAIEKRTAAGRPEKRREAREQAGKTPARKR